MMLLLSSPSLGAEDVSLESQPRQIKIQGRVVELGKDLSERYPLERSNQAAPVFMFKSDDGSYYTLIHTQRSEALFKDARFRQKHLILTGRLFPTVHAFEATSYHSIQDGLVHELYYYCVICAIKSISPDLCQCCREPVELVEKPIGD